MTYTILTTQPDRLSLLLMLMEARGFTQVRIGIVITNDRGDEDIVIPYAPHRYRPKLFWTNDQERIDLPSTTRLASLGPGAVVIIVEQRIVDVLTRQRITLPQPQLNMAVHDLDTLQDAPAIVELVERVLNRQDTPVEYHLGSLRAVSVGGMWDSVAVMPDLDESPLMHNLLVSGSMDLWHGEEQPEPVAEAAPDVEHVYTMPRIESRWRRDHTDYGELAPILSSGLARRHDPRGILRQEEPAHPGQIPEIAETTGEDDSITMADWDTRRDS